MKFLVDENLPSGVVTELSAKGFDAIKVSSGSSDAEVASLARKEERTLLTMDKDFANILLYPPREYFGIICFRIKLPELQIILKFLDSVLSHFGTTGTKGKLIVITDKGFRTR